MPAKKTAPSKSRKKTAKKTPLRKPSFGRSGTAGKAEGDAAVRTWIADLNPDHRAIAEKLDALIGETVPDVKRAVKWSMPMYGKTGIGWFATVASYKDYVSLRFFAGTSLEPVPPYGEGKSGMRAVNIADISDYDVKKFRSWIKQASTKKGWGSAQLETGQENPA